MRKKGSKLGILFYILCGILIYSAYNFYAYGQYTKSTLPPPPPAGDYPAPAKGDSIPMPYPVSRTIPTSYDDITSPGKKAVDLKNPKNITTVAEYDYTTGCYIIRTKIGDMEIATPFMLSSDEYNNVTLRKSMTEFQP